MAEKRTIERLWRDAVAAGRTTPAYLIQDGDDWRPLSWEEAAGLVESYANGLLSLGVRKGDAVSILATSRVEWALFDFALGSIGAIGAAIYANSSPKEAGYILEHSESVGVLCEDETQRAKVESVRGGMPRLRHVLTFADLEDLAARGRAHAAEHPNALREAAAQVEEDDLFTYIYTSGTTGPPEAPVRRLCGLRDRLPARPAPGGGRPAAGEAHGVSERSPRLREGAHGGPGKIRRRDRREAQADRLGTPGWPPGQRAPPRREAGSARARPPAPARGPAGLREGEGAAGRPPTAGDLRRRAAVAGDRGVLPRDRHPPRRGLWPDGVHDRRVDEHARGLPLRHGRAGAAGDGGQAGRGRRAADSQ